MHTSEGLSLEQIQAFLNGSEEVGFEGQNRKEIYAWVNQTLRQQRYEGLKRSERGIVRRYMEKMTGLSQAQTTRLIAIYVGGEEVKPALYRRRRFTRRYTGEDIALLAGADQAHETLSGRKLFQRALRTFHDTRYKRLAQISVALLYRLRGSRAYRERRIPTAGGGATIFIDARRFSMALSRRDNRDSGRCSLDSNVPAAVQFSRWSFSGKPIYAAADRKSIQPTWPLQLRYERAHTLLAEPQAAWFWHGCIDASHRVERNRNGTVDARGIRFPVCGLPQTGASGDL